MKLGVLGKEKIAELEKTISLARSGHKDQALAMVKSHQRLSVMDDTRPLVDQITLRAGMKVERARTAAHVWTYWRSSIFAITALANIAFLFWAYRRVRREMSARETAAADAREQRNLLAVTLASIGDAVIVTDVAARITFMNGEAEKLTGWSLSEATGKDLPSVFNIISEESRQSVESPVQKVLRLGSVVGLANHTLLDSQSGSEIPIDDSGATIRESNGPIRGVVLVFRDFSEHKLAEKQLKDSKAEA